MYPKLLFVLILSFIFTVSAIGQIPIRDIQYTTDPSGDSPLNGQVVTIKGIVTAEHRGEVAANGGISDKYFFVMDNKAAWSGIQVFYSDSIVAEGDLVTITGTVNEYFGQTQIKDVTGFIRHSTRNSLPGPVDVTTAQADSEPYEGCLVRVKSVTVIEINIGSYKNWRVDDGSGAVKVDTRAKYYFTPILNQTVKSLTGIVLYGFGEFSIAPRLAWDIEEGGAFTRIQRIQQVRNSDLLLTPYDEYSDTSYASGGIFKIRGVVTVPTGLCYAGSGVKFILTELGGGPWSSILSYSPDPLAYPKLVEGDIVEIKGYVHEFRTGPSNMTEFSAIEPIHIVETGAPIPPPDFVNTGDLRLPVTTEQWSSCLVYVKDATVVDVNPQYELFAVDDGSGSMLVDDDSDSLHDYYATNPKPPLGAVADSIRGWVYHHYGSYSDSTTYKLEPLYMSDLNFVQGPVELLVPNCHVVWQGGTTHKISWTPVNLSGKVNIEFSSDDGASWNTVISNTQDDGCYIWTLPNIQSNQCKLKISDVSDPTIYDENDVAFTIGTPSTPYLMVGDIAGFADSIVVADVTIGGNLTPLAAFGLDLAYDTNQLTFLAVQQGDLTTGWMMLDGYENMPGMITIGGLDPHNIIPTGSNGSIAKIKFKVTCTGCTECSQSHLLLADYYDGLTGMNGYCGTFTFLTCICGDVTMDQAFTASDALCAFRIFLRGGTVPTGYPECDTPCALTSADANLDGRITPADALGIFYRYLYGYWYPGYCGATLTKHQPVRLEVTKLSLGDITAIPGEKITLPIVVDNPSGMTAFGIQLNFPPDQLEFIRVSKTSLTKDWIALDGEEIDEGTITIGGFSPQAIDKSTSSVMAEVSFLVKSGGSETRRLVVSDLMDDLAFADVTHGSIRTDISEALPKTYKLDQNYPNPFNSETEIVYHLPEAGHVKLEIYNLLGQKIRTLVSRKQKAGHYHAHWSGFNESGQEMPSGIYIYRLETSNFNDYKKMLLLK